MRKSIKTVVTELNSQLSKIQEIVNLLEKKNLQGVTNLRDWLFGTEELFKKLNLPQGSKFSVKRGELTNFLPQEKRNKKKELFHFAAAILATSQEEIWAICSTRMETLDNCKKLIRQLLNLIYQSKAFTFDSSQDFTLFIENVWSFCNSHEQLRGITVQLLSLINKSDVLLIMAEEIDLQELT